jgi:hypothetical protein
MPSTVVGSGSFNACSAASTTAACAVGQVTPKQYATSATLRHASPTAAPIARRNRPVVRRPVAISSIDSVNDNRAHVGSTRRHRVLCQTTEIPVSPYGISRGAVVTLPLTDTTPHDGQPELDVSDVWTCATRPPNSTSSTCCT